MKDILLKYINEQFQADDPIEAQDDLLGEGILDSLGMMKLILFIETEFELKVPPQDMTIENFMSIDDMATYISNRK
ncbi:MAG: hypothetical protein Mars2KO_09800 [Maribacter sp.]|uniref:acyl carrier protein n=1 Tax=Maribacter sp. 2307UL18-2 TaxID=3386274 RepID=UPI0039BD5AC5